MSTAKFEARLWIDEESVRVETWAYELIPTDRKHCGAAEWAAHHLEEYDREFFLQCFELDPTKNWQVIFRGSIHGWYTDYYGDYDEDFDVESFETAEIPESYFKGYLPEDL